MKRAQGTNRNLRSIALWTLQVLLAAAFLMAGGSKLIGTPTMVDLFTAVGWGQWFRYLTGGIEVAAAILLLIPGISGLAALVLIPTMVGAILTHLRILHSSPFAPTVLLVLAIILLWGRRGEIIRFAGRRSDLSNIESQN